MKYNVFMVLIGYTYDFVGWREKSYKCTTDALKSACRFVDLVV